MFPIGIMYYYGTNLDEKFSVPGFWPKPENTHRIPYEREEMDKLLDELKQKRLANRDRRLQEEVALEKFGKTSTNPSTGDHT